MKLLNRINLIIITIIIGLCACENDDSILEKEFGSLDRFKSENIYSIIMIPDTQSYFRSEEWPKIFRQKIQWIVDNSKKLDVKFITHIGDVIEDGEGDINHREWKESFDILKSLDDLSKNEKIPYSISLGDHDYNGDEKPNLGYTAFVTYYGRKRYTSYPWYGGSSNTETSHYQYFVANGRKFLHLNVECDAPRNSAFPNEEDQLKWAQGIINENPNIPTILSTHAYITDEFINGKFIGHEPKPEVKKKNRRKGENRRGGLAIWNELVRRNDQIFMVLCGNYHEFENRKGDTGEYHQVSINNKGRKVIEILANYQGFPNGGEGLFRIIVFNEKEDNITVKTYSPYHKSFRKKYLNTPRASDFVISIDFKRRLTTPPKGITQ